MSQTKMKRLYTPREAAKYFQVSPRTIAKWCREGLLKSRKIGRVWRITSLERTDD